MPSSSRIVFAEDLVGAAPWQPRTLEGERREPFMLHYNFPPFSVGETGMMSGP